MKSRKSSPTRTDRPEKIVSAAVAERRVEPEIYVRVLGLKGWGRYRSFIKAHLRNKAGYLYLQWREGERVRSHYLGKAPKSSPTIELLQTSPAPPAGSRKRRVKK